MGKPWFTAADEPEVKKAGVGDALFGAREATGDCTLVMPDGARITVHKAVMAAQSEMMSRLLYTVGMRESADDGGELRVEGRTTPWSLVVSYLYTNDWFKLKPASAATRNEMLLALDIADFYGMPEAMKQSAIDHMPDNQGCILPMMVYAWAHMHKALMERVVVYLHDNLDRIAQSVLSGDVVWMHNFGILKSHNPRIGSLLARVEPTHANWSAVEVGSSWKRRISSFFALPENGDGADTAVVIPRTDTAGTGKRKAATE